MITDPRVRKRRVAKILAGGGTVLTNSLDRLPPHVAETLLSEADLREREEPLVASFARPGQWCLATTQRFIWKQENETTTLLWEEICDADLSDTDLPLVSNGTKRKDLLTELVIADSTGKKRTLVLAPGSDFVIIWSVLVALSAAKDSR